MQFPDDKFILSVVLLQHNPAEYRRLQQKELGQYCSPEGHVGRALASHLHRNGRYATPQRFHDIAGIAELYWNKNRILGSFFMRADRRTRWGKETCRANSEPILKPANFHPRMEHYELSRMTTPYPSVEESRVAVMVALDEVEKNVREWNMYCNTEHARKLVRHLDIVEYLSEP